MSLQSTNSIWKWNFIAAVRRGSYVAAVLALFLIGSIGHSQTIGTRTALSVAREASGTTFTVTVKDPSGAAIADGTVSFVSNGLSLGSAIVQADGTAKLTLDKIPAFAKQITAVYSGSGRYAASSSASAQFQANAAAAPPDFSVAANPTSMTLTAGDFGTVILTITPENGFTQSVTLAEAGLPTTTSSARFTPSIVTPTSTAAVTCTMQIQTTASSKSSRNQALPFGGGAARLAYAMIFPGVLALLGIGTLRKRNGIRMLGVALLLLASASGLTACSQRYSYLHHPPAANTGTPPGTYPVTITAYSNNGGEVTSHTLQLTLTVQ